MQVTRRLFKFDFMLSGTVHFHCGVVDRSKSLICDHSAPHRMGSSPGRGENFPADLQCAGGSTHVCEYSDIRMCGVFFHQLKLEVAI